jgi:diacylglycerol O-acyltransferase
MWHSTRDLLTFNREVGSPTIEMLVSDKPPRTRLNHTLSARRSFSRRQIPLAEVKVVGAALDGTINDVILALAATAIREYLLYYQDLPATPLATSIPVSADAPGAQRELGNRTTYFPTRLWTNMEDPLERFKATQRSTRIGKDELQVLGKDTFLDLMEFIPPFLSLWKTRRKQRLRVADRPDYHPMTNVIISNVPGPRERVSGDYGTLIDLYSMGPLVEGCGLNITVWSYAGNLNFSLMGCKKAIPDIERLADGLLNAHAEYKELAASAEQVTQSREEETQ